jgi:hypothetical protein
MIRALESQQLTTGVIAKVLDVDRKTVYNVSHSGEDSPVREPRKVTTRTGYTREAPRRKRPRSNSAEETRRRVLVRQLYEEVHPDPEGGQVWKRDQIATALDINHGTLREDLVAMGFPTRRQQRYRSRSGMPEGDFRWRDVDLEDDGPESETVIPSFAACDTPTANEAIKEVETQLHLILQGRYKLSLKDRNYLINVLNAALERVHRNDQQHSEDPHSGEGLAI